MSDEAVVKLDLSKWPRREIYIQKCDRCGEVSSFIVHGACYNCIVKLIQESADRTQEESK
jgi:uncharacterized OB-fold protein